jgi:hypothetical protein
MTMGIHFCSPETIYRPLLPFGVLTVPIPRIHVHLFAVRHHIHIQPLTTC